MTIKFCPKCKGILIPNKVCDKKLLVCDGCGFTKEVDILSLKSKEEIKSEKEKGTAVGEEKNVFATYKHKCEKCGYDKCEFIDLGPQISDEDELILLKCGKCGHVERVGRKVA